MTREQVAQLIFKDGKVPEGAKLVREPYPSLNGWHVQVDNEHDAVQKVVNHFNARTETSISSRPDEVSFRWSVGGPAKTSQRQDLKNDLGFTIMKKYKLDVAELPVDQHIKGLGRGEGAVGYEVRFEKALTKDQVMDKLIKKGSYGEGEVKLVAVPFEPSPIWQVQLIGAGAQTAFKDQSIHLAFIDAKDSIAPTVPAGVRAHIENRTVPKDATHHPPGTYVWEQDGHMVHVVKTQDTGMTPERSPSTQLRARRR